MRHHLRHSSLVHHPYHQPTTELACSPSCPSITAHHRWHIDYSKLGRFLANMTMQTRRLRMTWQRTTTTWISRATHDNHQPADHDCACTAAKMHGEERLSGAAGMGFRGRRGRALARGIHGLWHAKTTSFNARRRRALTTVSDDRLCRPALPTGSGERRRPALARGADGLSGRRRRPLARRGDGLWHTAATGSGTRHGT